MLRVFLLFVSDICIKLTKTVQTTPPKAPPAAGKYSLRCTIFPPAAGKIRGGCALNGGGLAKTEPGVV